jgi:hypothetical protein
MTSKQARKLLVGTVVMFDKDPHQLGTVRAVDHNRVYIDWHGEFTGGFLPVYKMGHIQIFQPKSAGTALAS